jgi:hypothetical protein
MRACQFFDITAPAAKTSNKPQLAGHVENDSTCPAGRHYELMTIDIDVIQYCD